ncbi:MAG: hypothetical protein JSR82_03285 [Verrucomicrobia bacterium]|nr:hypothetical protein [Verrucomicrobiota bacterium]
MSLVANHLQLPEGYEYLQDPLVLVDVPVAIVDELWSRSDRLKYIPPGAFSNGPLNDVKPAKYDAVRNKILGGRERFAPYMRYWPRGDQIGFTDGRHRFAAFRDLGYPKILAAMHKSEAIKLLAAPKLVGMSSLA